MNRRDLLAAGLASLSMSAFASRRTRAAYPERPIRLIVPFAPGGATDVVGRLWADRIRPNLGTVVTENKASGGRAPRASEVARAPARRHTFLLGHTSTQGLLAPLMRPPAHDPPHDF